MEGILKKIQDITNKYALVLSKILKVDVEIVDDNLERIAGTGLFREKINVNISNEGYVYKTVIKTGSSKIIENPGKHELCTNCPKKNNCDETFEMSTPIKVFDKVIGVIGFVCFNDKQKKHIIENYKIFSEFLDQISELIALKALEEIEKEKTLSVLELLNNILNKIEQGVIIYDSKNRIIKVNSIGAGILNLNEENWNRKISIIEKPNYIMNLKQYELIIDDRKYDIAGKEYKMTLNNNEYNKVLIFEDVNFLKEKILSITSVKENIGLDKIIGESQEIKNLKEKVMKIALSSSTVLITGESGTGKELFARAIHEESDRSNSPFVAINCAAIPDTLLESELFGYVKGAFTGANPKGKIGKIELANNGTLFLDEIGDMPLYLQAKLLRVLEQREIIRLGANHPVPVNIRVIAATNKKLENMISDKTFRKDLYYRLNVIPIEIPPLRERKNDIRLLSMYFINKYSKLFNKNITKIEDEVWKYLNEYPWLGNVRELQNTIEYMINMVNHNGVIKLESLPSKILNLQEIEEEGIQSLECIEKECIKKAILIYGTNVEAKKVIAEKLGIGVATLYRKIKKYNLDSI